MKFVINSIKARQLASNLIGYGGLPSNHSAIVSSMVALITFKHGIGHLAFGVALTLAFIVMLDANSLHQQVGKHAATINRLATEISNHQPLRERMGHTCVEIAAGMAAGIAVAAAVNAILPDESRAVIALATVSFSQPHLVLPYYSNYVFRIV